MGSAIIRNTLFRPDRNNEKCINILFKETWIIQIYIYIYIVTNIYIYIYFGDDDSDDDDSDDDDSDENGCL